MLEDSDSSHVIATSVHVGDSLQGTPDFNKIIVDDGMFTIPVIYTICTCTL